MLRLERVGLLRRPEPDRIQFAADRMLNWAVAESLSNKIQEDGLSATESESLFGVIDRLMTRDKYLIGSRLGYVYFDALWLLARNCSPEFVADLIWQHVVRRHQETRGEDSWRNGFGSLGAKILPALEIVASNLVDEERDWDTARNIAFALAAIAVSDPVPVEKLIARQVGSVHEHLARVAAYNQIRDGADINAHSRAMTRQRLSSDALHVAITANPHWVDVKLATETDVIAINQLLWLLKDEETVESDLAAEIWERHRNRIVALMPSPSAALIEMIGHFRESSLTPVLDAAPASEDFMQDRVLRSRARLAPHDAIRQIAEGSDAYGWRAANWWFDELAAADPGGLASAILRRAYTSADPLTEIIFYYRFNPEAMDAGTLNKVLDLFAEKLLIFNSNTPSPDDQEGRLYHPLRFLPRLSEPWQFDALRSRAGTELEIQLVHFAAARQGRTSMTGDSTGNECERILAMIAGSGYDDLVCAELMRPNVFGRQDGFMAARWSSDDRTAAALAELPVDPDTAIFGRIVQMEALAVHCCDQQIETMVRAGTPVYLNAAEMRCSNDRDVSGLRARISVLLASGDRESLDTAAALTSFLGSINDALPLVAVYVAPTTDDQIRRRILASFRALRFYSTALLPLARQMIAGKTDKEAGFVATYLAEAGDDEARQAVIDWLSGQNFGRTSAPQGVLLNALLRHPAGKIAVIEHLQRSRANGRYPIYGKDLRLLAEAGDNLAQEELVRASYRYSDFDRYNTIIAIDYLRQEEP